MGPKHIGVMTLTFRGHVTSSVTWPFEPQVHTGIDARLQPSIFSRCQDYGQQTYRCHDLHISGSCDVIGHVTIRFSRPYLVLLHLCHRVASACCLSVRNVLWLNGAS